ncbi:MAG: hypothetical protein ABI609_13750 [Acidobacteriota bacterium]
MKAFVFTDAALASYARQVVWLDIDTEKAANAAVLEKYPVSAWPSLFIIDPVHETVLLRWTGTASVEQLIQFVDQGKRALAAGQTGLAAQLATADRLNGAGNYATAAPAYAAVLAAAPKGWPDLPRTSDAYLFALQITEQSLECVQAAHGLLARLEGTPSYANAAVTGLDCALSLEKSVASRGALIAHFETACRQVLDAPGSKLAADDRSGIYQELIAAREDAGDEVGKKALETAWIAGLEKAANEAPTPAARAAFDSHRLGAYLEIDQPQRAVDMLLVSERDFPNDYNPPARLAMAYRALKDLNKALAASDRALSKAYGPRRISILRTRAEIFKDKGEPAEVRKTLEQALSEAKAMPAGQRSESTIAGLEKRLAALSQPASK